jgi:hypothetical protein
MPSTSVQIWISSASRAAPRTAADQSLPPRPSVVATPLRVLPMKPGRMGTLRSSTSGLTVRAAAARVSSIRGAARPNVSSVMITPRASTPWAAMPSPSRPAATIS